MAENTITGLIPDIYEAMDVVSREQVGMIPSVTMSASAERAAKDTNIRIPSEPVGNVSDITPAMQPPEPTGQTTGYTDLVITKERAAEFGFIGNTQMALNAGSGFANSRAGKIAQAIRALVNEVETDLCALQSTFSRAYGTPGTTPFGTANDYTAATFAAKILKDNGGFIDPQLVIDSAAGANFIGKQSAVNAAGTDSMLRQGVLLDLAGMPLRESGKVNQAVTAGTGASYTTDTAGYAVGATAITLITGTGTVLAGDHVTFAGDTNKYVVAAGVAAPGVITLAAPGLRQPIAASAVAMTIGAASTRSMCFARSALVLGARAPALPEEGDMAMDRQIITDPRSGLSLEFSMYKGYRKVRYEVALAWGVKNVKPEHTAQLLG